MKSTLKTFASSISIGLFLPILVFAQSLSAPHHFFGSVNFTNGAAPNGMTVDAKIYGAVVGSSVTSGGNYGYNSSNLPNNLLFALDNEGVHEGKTIEFYVNGIKANETAVFVNGASNQKNLTIPASLPTTPTPTQSSTNGRATTPTTPTTPLSEAAKKVDANKDNKIDVLDFTVLMIHWGSTGVGNVADFNSDGKADILDFTLLMIHWTI